MEIGSEACENTNDQTHQVTNELVNSHEEPEALISNSGPHATTTLTEENVEAASYENAELTNYEKTKPSSYLPPVEHVPISSYTSSDEEEADEFFDANEQLEITVDEMEKSLKLEEDAMIKKANAERKTNGEEMIEYNENIENKVEPR